MAHSDGRFDRLIAAAWPATYCECASGDWVLRFADGVTKRANSVLPLGDPGDVDAAIDGAERFYAARGRAAVFSIGDGAWPGLDGRLAARGYHRVDPTLIMTMDLAQGPDSPSLPPPADDGATCFDDIPSPEWLALWSSVDGRHADRNGVARKILTGVAADYAWIADQAVGRGVAQGEWYGIYCMAVAPDVRRRGLGGMMLHALLRRARRQGARHAYLAVIQANRPARALYERAGFRVAGRYHYRLRPRTGGTVGSSAGYADGHRNPVAVAADIADTADMSGPQLS